jgi:calcineurin-like phosphoesterase family protein
MIDWVIADTHFGHFNIIRYCDRPFETSEEMDEVMISNWNSVVSPEDRVYHLGDFAFGRGSKELIEPIARRLNGYIILLKGNHDRESIGWYKNRGFDEVHGDEFFKYPERKKVIFSHRPYPTSDCINIYGHMHNLGVVTPGQRYTCVSVELTDYFPVTVESVLPFRGTV